MVQFLAAASCRPVITEGLHSQALLAWMFIHRLLCKTLVVGNKTQICIANAQDRSGPELQFFLPFNLS
jgi:hypothetical protein